MIEKSKLSFIRLLFCEFPSVNYCTIKLISLRLVLKEISSLWEIMHKEKNCFISSRSEIPGKFRNVVLEKDGEDQLDRSCEK